MVFSVSKQSYSMNSKQIIVAIEGIDGAGKTTLINELHRFYNKDAIVYCRTRKGMLINKLVSSTFLQKHYMLQVPIYLLLSYKNYILFKLKNIKLTNKKIIIMDRCFLSNICYFFPKAIQDISLFKKVLFFEIKLIPQVIFILDVNPQTGQIRDCNRKPLNWLNETRKSYLASLNSILTKWVNIELIQENLSIEKKCETIIQYIKEMEQW